LCSANRYGAPRIEVVGVYRLDVPEDLFREQFDILYGDPMSDEERVEAEKQCREQLSSVVLIELLVENRDASFSISDFSQPQGWSAERKLAGRVG